MLTLRTLDVYRCAVELVAVAHLTAERCPSANKELADQLRRAAPSILLNLSEGNGKDGRDRRRYYLTARASASECIGIFELCGTLRIISGEECEQAMVLLERLVAMLTGMARG
jgi:four helix bundle protein